MKGADGLWHPCTELDHPGVHSVWSQVIEFSQVELRFLQKRSWRVVISPKCKFEDDILSREARVLLRGLQVMVCAEHVRNARVPCLTDSMSCALAFERRRAWNCKRLVQIRKLTSLCLCHQIILHVRWIASESNCSDDPSRRYDSSQHAPFSSCADESLTYGEEGTMFARPPECGHSEPESSSRVLSGGAVERDHKPALHKCGALGKYRVFRWLGPVPTHDLGPRIKIFLGAFGTGPSAENFGKSKEKCKNRKMVVFGQILGPQLTKSCQSCFSLSHYPFLLFFECFTINTTRHNNIQHTMPTIHNNRQDATTHNTTQHSTIPYHFQLQLCS